MKKNILQDALTSELQPLYLATKKSNLEQANRPRTDNFVNGIPLGSDLFFMKLNFVLQIYYPLNVKCVCVCVCCTYLSLYIKFDATPPQIQKIMQSSKKYLLSIKQAYLSHGIQELYIILFTTVYLQNSILQPCNLKFLFEEEMEI